MVSLTDVKGWPVTLAMVLALCMILMLPVSQVSSADMTCQVTNVGCKSFTVTWVTNTAETGYVNYGTSTSSLDNTAYDKRGQKTGDNTHHVTITDLTASTTYYYEIVCGGTTFNNGGIPYEISTGPDLGLPPMPEIISGKVYQADGVTGAEGSIIYASIGTSQVLSALVDNSGTWALDIAPIRTADYQSYYTHSDSDDIRIEAQGGIDGIVFQIVSATIAKDGTLAMKLTPDATAGEMITNVDEAIQSGDVATKATPEETETEPDKGINLWLIGGVPAGVIILATIAGVINKNRY